MQNIKEKTNKYSLRTITVIFLYAEILDILTSFIGIKMGLTEKNPIVYALGWNMVILIKILGTIIIAIFLEKKKHMKYDIIFPIIAILPTAWNAFQFSLILIFS